MIRIFGTIFAGLLGLAFGSFLNVCLSRWPEGESVVEPRSHCRNCDHTLAWWENVPLVSWLVLRGRCRECGAWIGWRYPLVEAAVGGLWAVPAWRLLGVVFEPEFPPDQSFFHFSIYNDLAIAVGLAAFYWLLIGLAVLDAENLWLPNSLTFPGIALGVVFYVVYHGHGSRYMDRVSESALNATIDTTFSSVGSALLAAGLIQLIRWVYMLVRKQEGMGLGDAKLMAMLAAWLGLPGALLAFFLGAVLGSIAGVVLLAVPAARRGSGSWGTSKLPFGTFLCIGGIASSLWGQSILAAYMRWAGF